jgi:hypothetical protein
MVQHHDPHGGAQNVAAQQQGESARAPGRNDEMALTVSPAEEITESDNENSGSKSRRLRSWAGPSFEGFGYNRRGSAGTVTSDSARKRGSTLQSLGSYVMGRRSSVVGDEIVHAGMVESMDKRERTSMSPWRSASLPKRMALDRQESMAVLNSNQLKKKGKRAISLMLGDMNREELAKLLATTEMEKLVTKVFAKYDAKRNVMKATGTRFYFFCPCVCDTPRNMLHFRFNCARAYMTN